MKRTASKGLTISSRKRAKFLERLRDHGCVARASRESNLNRQNVYRVRVKDEEFAESWDTALEECFDAMEAEAKRRGVDGIKENVYFKGERIGEVTKYSDNLLMFVLKAKRPEFRDRTAHEITGPEGKPFTMTFAQLVGSVDIDNEE